MVYDKKTIDGLDGTQIANITQKIRTFDEMAAGAFGRAWNYG